MKGFVCRTRTPEILFVLSEPGMLHDFGNSGTLLGTFFQHSLKKVKT